MAQRWMQAKEQLARRHGKVRSGCNRALGSCGDDILIRRGTKDHEGTWFHPVSDKNGAHKVARKPRVARPNRAARRAHLQG